MGLFLSTYRKNIDKKGRVSVPSAFRAVLAEEDFSASTKFNGVILYNSFVNDCIEACGMSQIEKLHHIIENLDPFAEEKDAFAATILGGSVQLTFDSEGRVILPAEMLISAHIVDEVVFVGKGKSFELWEPTRFDQHAKNSRILALEKRGQLHSVKGGAS